MAKELPYFKFEPAEYIAGDIQDCSLEAQGVFINLCSLYWIREGVLMYASALQRICNGNESALQELINVEVISIEEKQIVIDFLDEQLDQFVETSKKRRKAANKRWSDANAMQVQSKSNAIREEKIREEKSKEDKIKKRFSFKDALLHEYYVEEKYIDDWLKVRKNKKAVNSETAFNGFMNQVLKSKLEANQVVKLCAENSWASFKAEWVKDNKTNSQTYKSKWT